MLPLALSHTDFPLPPGGAQALCWLLDLELGVGRKREEGLCAEMLCLGEGGGAVGEGSRELSLLFCCSGQAPFIFHIPRYTQGAPREPSLCPFQNEDTQGQGRAGCHGGTMAQLLSCGARFRTCVVNPIFTANLFLLRISLCVH